MRRIHFFVLSLLPLLPLTLSAQQPASFSATVKQYVRVGTPRAILEHCG